MSMDDEEGYIEHIERVEAERDAAQLLKEIAIAAKERAEAERDEALWGNTHLERTRDEAEAQIGRYDNAMKEMAESLTKACAAKERAEAALKELSDELAEWVEHYYADMKHYPNEKRRYERDIGPVHRARALLSPTAEPAKAESLPVPAAGTSGKVIPR